jgi:hypothetical protein
VVSGIDPVESYRFFNMGMVVYTDRDNQEHALAPLEPLSPKPIGEVKEGELAVVNGGSCECGARDRDQKKELLKEPLIAKKQGNYTVSYILMVQIEKVFDPYNIFNPGKVL